MLDMSTNSTTASASTVATGLALEEVVSVSGDTFQSESESNPTEIISFSSGNPRIEETTGVMHLFTNQSSSHLPVGRNPLVGVLGVPNHMTYADFCQFCGSFIQHILEMRIVRSDGMEDRYSILIRFDCQDSADNFYKYFNGRRFSSLEVEVCHVLFTVNVQYTGLIEHALSLSANSTEAPSCPVWLSENRQSEKWELKYTCS
ncbi:BRCA1-associated 2 [Dillenia turbinata]|uniref:BRCA1-associated 2 n=1 Tax=Dillenia turbinata TaxID=194707 RepID=A0AAN8ZGA7_9MAGN